MFSYDTCWDFNGFSEKARQEVLAAPKASCYGPSYFENLNGVTGDLVEIERHGIKFCKRGSQKGVTVDREAVVGTNKKSLIF